MYGHVAQNRRKTTETRSEVKEMVRNLVAELETLQGNLNQVVGDIRMLVEQIDSVTTRIDEKYGVSWREENKVRKSKTSRKEKKDCINKNINGEITKPETVREEFSRDKLRVEDTRSYDASPDLDLSYLHITPGEQRSRWGRSLIFSDSTQAHVSNKADPSTKLTTSTVSSDKANSNETENSITSLQTCIPIARCYAQIRRDSFQEETLSPEANLRVISPEVVLPMESPNIDLVEAWATDTGNYVHEESPDVPSSSGLKHDSPGTSNSPQKRSPEVGINLHDIALNFVYGAQTMATSDAEYSDTISPNLEDLLRNVNENSGLSYDLINSRIVNVDSSSDHNTDSSDNDDDDYDGMYERLMERQLENLSASSECSGCSESSEYNMELGSLEKSDCTSFSDDIEVRYDRDINTWTSYTLAHMNSSARSSDSFLSETTSDILNDNTQATITYGNMIFSDKLVLLNAPKCSKKRHNNANPIPVHQE